MACPLESYKNSKEMWGAMSPLRVTLVLTVPHLHFDGKSIKEFPVKSPMLNLEDIEWKTLLCTGLVPRMRYCLSHDNLNFYFSACALWIFFAGNLLEKEFCFEKNDRISQICCPLLCSC